MKRIQINQGDVFEVSLENKKRYFQFILLDSTQLNSEVIRAFSSEYSKNYIADITEIVRDDVQFYAHTMIRLGYKMGLFDKVGNSKLNLVTDTVWRTSADYGNPQIKVSKKWFTWRSNEEMKKFKGKRKNLESTELGTVVNPNDIIDRLTEGKYDFFYPDY